MAGMGRTVVLVGLVLVLWAGTCRAAEVSPAPAGGVVAEQLARRTIYHSPQTPGYTCWVGAWPMPDNSLMVTCKQATGPVEGRPRSVDLLRRMKMNADDPRRDFTGLRLANVYLRSADGGATWATTAEEEFPGPLDRPSWGGSHVALKDGTVLRAVDGSQLPLVPNLPRRIFVQRSADLGKTWGPPEVPPEPRRPAEVLGDAGDCVSRVRRLRDGRLIATGVIRPDAGDRRVGEPLLMFSPDDGKTWQPQRVALVGPQRDPGAWNEWDAAELPDGRLLCVFRRTDPRDRKKQVRWQGVLREKGDGWALDDYRPSVFEHSGHPELLAAREGIVLHIATTGTHWTADAGATWHPLEVRGGKAPYRSRYYPRSVQADDGRIYVFSHSGSDNGYGEVDQSIVMDTFRLATGR